MSNSALVNYIAISPNSHSPRKDTIKKITIHHMAGNLSVETCGKIFAGSSRKASSNYSIGTDGRVGMYVEEKNRAWTSSSPANDHQAITIEVANDQIGGDWHVSDTALNRLIDLCADICLRNGIAALNYTGDTTGNLTRHNMFAATGCPGTYLQSKFPYIADEVNKRLAPQTESEGDFKVKTYKNGSTKEYVYKTTSDCNKQNKLLSIGSLNEHESCECYGVVDGCRLVVYNAGGTKKTGFVKYSGGVL